MDNKSTTKRMIGAVVLVLIAALLLAWLLKGKNQSVQEQQELIAQQTQDATPILGFPGVKEGEEDPAQATQEGDAPYVIGDADGQQDSGAAQQDGAQAQTDQAGEQQQVADAGAADDKGTGVGATVAGAATAGKQAVQNLADNFQVRDSDGKQRQVVGDGEVKAGTGSMGSSEIAIPKQADAGADTNAGSTDSAAQNQNTEQTQAAAGGDAGATATTEKAEQTASGNAAGGDSGATQAQSAPAKQAVANPKLVDEKPVPAPKAQTAEPKVTSTADSGDSGSQSSSQQAAGGSGYAIQVLAASSRNKAEQVRQSIAVDGYPVFVVKANVNGKTVYRVRIGTYPARNAARAVQSRMKARYTKNQYVQNSFVTRN